MKKFLSMVIALILFVLPMAVAETAETVETEVAPLWYELSAEDTVLTVRLPGNTKSGLTWNFEISDPEALELITQETIEGESEGMAGAPTTYVASFMTTANEAKNVSLILTCNSEDVNEGPVYARVLELSTDADNKLAITAILERDPMVDWIEMDPVEYIFTVRIPGDDWNFMIVDEEVIELITCEDSEGTFVASFTSTLITSGTTEIVFSTDDGLEYYTINVFVNESGMIFIEWVEFFQIM